MKFVKTFLIVIPLLVLITIIWLGKRTSTKTDADKPAEQQQVQLRKADPGTIDEMIVQALTEGKTKVSTVVIVEHNTVSKFAQAKRSYSIFVARADSKQSLLYPFQISTWFRFTVSETLSVVAPHICKSNSCAPPADVAAAGATEMLVPKSGGTIVKDGVTVNLNAYEFPDFTIGQTYLLFVDYDPSVRVGVPSLGPIGVFAVDSAGTLTALLDSSELKNDIAKRFGNSLSQLKVALAGHK